jgi:spermidine synthase
LRPWGLAFIAGFTAFAVAYLAMRMLAPYYGLTPFLASTVTAVALGSLALAQALAPRASGSLSSLGIPAVLAACWTMALPWLRTPLLSALDGLGLRAATVLGAVLLIGPCLIAIGITLPVTLRLATATLADVPRAASRTMAAALAGGLVAALIVPLGFVSRLGLRRATLVVAFVELAGAALAVGARKGAAAPAAVAVLAAVLLASKLSASPREPRWGLDDVRYGAASELRVLDRNGARYLLSDGTVHTVISTDDAQPLTRTSAALELLKLLEPKPDSVLVVGLRGGAVARAFARDGWTVRVVDPDPTAAAVTERWMRLEPAEAQIVTADPRVYLRTHASTYPLIVLDAYADSAIPVHLVTEEFFRLVASRLRRGGIVAVSVETQGWLDPYARALAATLRRSFRVVHALPTGEPPNRLGAVVFVASDRPMEIADERLPDPGNYHADPEGQWVVQQINHAWLNRYRADAEGGRVLTDDGAMVDLWTERLNAATRRELHAFFGRNGRSW